MPRRRRGNGSIYRRGRIWWMSFYVNGVHRCESAKTRDRNEAGRLLKIKVGQIEEGRLVVGTDRVKFEDLIDGIKADYRLNGRKTLDKVELRGKHLARSFAGMRANDIGAGEIRAFITQRHDEGASNGEINRELSVLQRAFNLALQAERITRKPYVPRLREASPRAGFFEERELRAVLGHLVDYLCPAMRFAYLTGWRLRSEILRLLWRNVDFDAGTVRLDVGSTKNGDGRVIYMTTELRQLLEEQRRRTLALQRERECVIPLVFHNSGKPISNYYKAWHRACRDAKIAGKIPHDFRRTAVRNMVRAGIPERVAMQMAGHRTRAVFDRYHVVSDGDLREAAKKQEGGL